MSSDEVHGYCLDCGKKMSDKWMYRNAFVQAGQSPSCSTCGGVVAVIHAKDAQREIAKNQQSRGINKDVRGTSSRRNVNDEELSMPEIPLIED